ncbi:MAG: hypothetical protein QM749_18885 [Aquabacterium sp.]
MTKFIPVRIAGLHPQRLIGSLLRVKAQPRLAAIKPVQIGELPKDKDLLQRLREAGL